MLVTCSRGFRIGIYDGQSRTACLVAKLILSYKLAKLLCRSLPGKARCAEILQGKVTCAKKGGLRF